jgi:hypothetical protein
VTWGAILAFTALLTLTAWLTRFTGLASLAWLTTLLRCWFVAGMVRCGVVVLSSLTVAGVFC